MSDDPADLVIVLGICDICGGQVQVPRYWSGGSTDGRYCPVPTCILCGAVEDQPPALPTLRLRRPTP